MQTSDPLKNRSARSPDLRRAGLALVLTSLATGILAGCDSNGGNTLDEFLGTWSTDEAHSAFGPLTCNLPNGSIGPVMFSLWGNLMTLEPGTLVDLVEITGTCPFDFNVKGKVATVPVPDPYADKTPCRIDISGSIAPGTEFLEFQPAIWKFDLLQPQKGVAAPARMHGSADVVYVAVDPTGAETLDRNACTTYDVDAHFFKIASH